MLTDSGWVSCVAFTSQEVWYLDIVDFIRINFNTSLLKGCLPLEANKNAMLVLEIFWVSYQYNNNSGCNQQSSVPEGSGVSAMVFEDSIYVSHQYPLSFLSLSPHPKDLWYSFLLLLLIIIFIIC